MRQLLALTLVLFTAFPGTAQQSAAGPIFGFSPDGSARQRALEATFDARLNRENLRDWLKRLSARPHHLGSEAGRKNAELIASMFESWGYDTRIEQFDVLFPTPAIRVVEMVAPQRFVMKLAEVPLAQDATSGQTREQLPTYNAYSVDGEATGEVVYVNYGIPRDYEELARKGIDVRGKIVLARYGGSWRGIKPKVAAEHGAVGCLIYSDPRDDGYFQGDVYPKGAYRNESGVQRGSVADMPIYPGDPLTPGVAATPAAKRLPRDEAKTLTKIPVLPISYGDALPLLRALGGPVAPQSWRGALATTYHLGPGPAKVHMKVSFDWKLVPALNVIAMMKGAELPDQWVIRGNHHDAWVNGADDPLAGLIAMMEEARAIGELAKEGRRPRRSLVYAAWDGEEQGLLGSTEWVEAHRDELRQKAVVYINSDSNGRGFLSAGGSHAFERLVTEVASAVTDPQTKVSVLERRKARDIADAETVSGRKEIRERELLRLSALGSGSDYTPFFQHAGVASLNIGYGGEDGGGSYHSIYDSFDHYTRFGDPGFTYGVTQAMTTGRLVLRLANAETLPFEMSATARTMWGYLDEVMKLADDTRAEVDDYNRQVRDRTMVLASDPSVPLVPGAEKRPVPHLNFAPLRNALSRVEASARDFDRRRPLPSSPALDRMILRLEQSLTREEGLPGREWYKHHVYAPGQYTGYGVKTFPAVREAIELHQWEEANRQIGVLAEVLNGHAAALERATAAGAGAGAESP